MKKSKIAKWIGRFSFLFLLTFLVFQLSQTKTKANVKGGTCDTYCYWYNPNYDCVVQGAPWGDVHCSNRSKYPINARKN